MDTDIINIFDIDIYNFLYQLEYQYIYSLLGIAKNVNLHILSSKKKKCAKNCAKYFPIKNVNLHILSTFWTKKKSARKNAQNIFQ